MTAGGDRWARQTVSNTRITLRAPAGAVLMHAVRNDPAMQAQHLVTYELTNQLLAKVIAERTGTDAERDLAPRLLAAAAGLALRTSVELWAEGVTDTALPDLVRESLAQLRAGLRIGATAAA